VGSNYSETVEINPLPSHVGKRDHDPKRPQLEENGAMEDSDEDVSISKNGHSRKGDSRTSGKNHGQNIGGFHVEGTIEIKDPTTDF
jgi:hypothetical protein